MRVPREIETKLRKELGDIIPYMSIVDVATRELLNQNTMAEIQQISRPYEHSRLSLTHREKNTTMRFVFLPQIAFIAGKAESFCDDVRSFVNQNTQTQLSLNLDGLDKLRKTIFILALTRTKSATTLDCSDESLYHRNIDVLDLATVDYYRKLRNIQFHGGLRNQKLHPSLSEETGAKIKKKYKYKPNHLHNLTARYPILYSRAWQSIAMSVCRQLVDVDVVIQKLIEKYSRLTKPRRDKAIANALRQDCLQKDDLIEELRNRTNGWLAYR